MSASSRRNRLGLRRDIPAVIKRTVRQECRFGCIFCGEAIYEYHHIVPFSKVRGHSPRNIALLCGTCHSKVTRNITSEDAVRNKRLDPYRLSHRWPSVSCDPNADRFLVILGGAQFLNPRTVLRVLGRDLLSLREPESDDGPIRLSAAFFDNCGKKCLIIEDNECMFNPDSWDIETKRNVYMIRRAPQAVALRIRLAPDRLDVEKLDMRYRGVHLTANKQLLKVFSRARKSFDLSCRVTSPDVGIEISRKRSGNIIEVGEPRRTINILGHGGNYTITGRQPPNSTIIFLGGAHTLTLNADATVHVGGQPAKPGIGLALSMRWAMKLDLEDLEILIGTGARAATFIVG